MEDLLLEPIVKSKRGIIGDALMDLIKKSKKRFLFTSPYLGEWKNYEKKLKRIEDVRMICQIENSATDPSFVQNLLKTNSKIQVRCCKDIHAKVYLGDSTALLGSANLTEPGMGLWNIEAATKIDEKEKLDTINAWYEKLWRNLNDDPRTYDKMKWDDLKEKWNNRERQSTKESGHFYDELLKTKKLSKILGFIFWSKPDKSTPDKSDILEKVKDENKLLKEFDDSDLEVVVELEETAVKIKKKKTQLKDFFNRFNGKRCISVEIQLNKTETGINKFLKIDSIVSPFACYPYENNFVGIYKKIGKINDKDKNRKFIELMNKSLSFSKPGWKKNYNNWKNDVVFGFLDTADLSKLLFK